MTGSQAGKRHGALPPEVWLTVLPGEAQPALNLSQGMARASGPGLGKVLP